MLPAQDRLPIHEGEPPVVVLFDELAALDRVDFLAHVRRAGGCLVEVGDAQESVHVLESIFDALGPEGFGVEAVVRTSHPEVGTAMEPVVSLVLRTREDRESRVT